MQDTNIKIEAPSLATTYVILAIVAVRFAPGLFGTRTIIFEKTPAATPPVEELTKPIIPETQEKVRVFFTNGEDEEKDKAVSKSTNPKLRITDTPTGWLNVRDDASLDGNIITKVYPNEEYEYTNEQNGWYQIILSNGELGWIFGKFAELLEE
jgi:hypothetical protein